MRLLESNHQNVCEQAVWALGNIIGQYLFKTCEIIYSQEVASYSNQHWIFVDHVFTSPTASGLTMFERNNLSKPVILFQEVNFSQNEKIGLNSQYVDK